MTTGAKQTAQLHKDIDLVLRHRKLADHHAGEDANNLAWTNGITLLGLSMVFGSLAIADAFHGWRTWLWTAAVIETMFGVAWLLLIQFLWRAAVVSASSRRIASGWAAVTILRAWTDLVTRVAFAITVGTFLAAISDHWKAGASAQRVLFFVVSTLGVLRAFQQFRRTGRNTQRYDAPAS